jgi:hypothetical protein
MFQGGVENMEEKSNQSRFLDNLLALLITVLSVLTAFVTYLAADTDGKSTEFYFLAQSNLSDANFYYLQGNLDVSTDYEN